MNDTTRQELKDQVAASGAQHEQSTDGAQSRSAHPASVYPSGAISMDQHDDDGVLGFVKEHPLVTIAGAVAVGVLVAGMFPSARKAARKSGAKASVLGAMGTKAALAAFEHMMEAGEDAAYASGETIEDLGDSIADSTRGVRRKTRRIADRAVRKVSRRIPF